LSLVLEQQNKQLELTQKIVFENNNFSLFSQIYNNFSLFSQIRKQEYEDKIKEKEEKEQLKKLGEYLDDLRNIRRKKVVKK
jgi:hypothetical protein